LEDLGIDGEIILQWLLEKWVGEVQTGFMCLRMRALVNRVINPCVP
jgi:hypothetical protein